ncbi:cytochrome P450 [Coniochaeta ligniaria NRRL 30616]|uniref:Cytochrome P450 n=1 Tax=Coniochaeta ligniaria NRRL 30616 TaxID=1408157 RepID=A0A1J7ITM4_9PEZI|nr:cytochrome P450 [Coniochaeta ligniaria NRRL 30616]
MSFAIEVDGITPYPRVLAAVVVILLTYHFILHPSLISPLAKIPNAHWSAPYSRLWALSIRFNNRENRTLRAAHQRLGPIIRVAPNELSINDVDCVRTVYHGGFDKPSWYSVFDNYGVPCMFSTRSAHEHSLRKRMISHVYSKSYIHSSAAAASQAHTILFDRLLPIIQASTTDTPKPHGLDVHSVFLAATMDFISAYVFGLSNGTNFLQDAAYRSHWLELYASRNNHGFYDQELPLLTRICRALGIPFCPWFVDYANAELGAWCRALCTSTLASSSHSHLPSPANQPVVLSALLTGLSKEAAHGPSSPLYPTALRHHDKSVASELFDHVLAGQETAGVTLTYLTWRLSQSPSLQTALRKELLSLTPNLALTPSGPFSLPDPKSLDALPLLHALLTETLRLHAPIPGAQPRQTPPQGCELGGYAVPGGVRVAAMAYALHRDEGVFPLPETWEPQRWLPGGGASEQEQKEMNRAFWAFSSGGRMCVGRNFALYEMKLIVAAIYSNYTSHVVSDDGMAEQSDGYTSRPAKERLFLRFERVE